MSSWLIYMVAGRTRLVKVEQLSRRWSSVEGQVYYHGWEVPRMLLLGFT